MTRDVVMGTQRWRDLLFLHWEVDAAAVRSLLPDALDVDTFDGRAYAALVLFTMHGVRPVRFLPPVPTAASFPEANVRTYVRYRGRPGVFFFSLDAGSTLAVLGARATAFLPYYRARMSAAAVDGGIAYRTRRILAGPRPAEAAVDYRAGAPLGPAAPGTLEHFLVERYVLYSVAPTGHLLSLRVRHPPYPLHAASVTAMSQSMLAAARLPHGAERTPDLYSPGVDVEIMAPRLARAAE